MPGLSESDVASLEEASRILERARRNAKQRLAEEFPEAYKDLFDSILTELLDDPMYDKETRRTLRRVIGGD